MSPTAVSFLAEIPELAVPRYPSQPAPGSETGILRAAQLVIDQFLAWGVDVFFPLPGGPAAPVFRALAARLDRIRYLCIQDERAAGHCADFYFRVSGRLAVCVVTAGPGVSNLRTALYTAKADGSALFVIAAVTPLRWKGKTCAQELDIEAELKPAVKRRGGEYGYAVLEDPRQGPELVRRLMRFATRGVPGPVVLVIPPDVGVARVTNGADLIETEMPLVERVSPPDAAIAEAVRLLKQARRPVVVAGYGCVLARAAERILWLADQMGYPVATSARAKAVFPEPPFHPGALGVLGLGGRVEATAAVADADVILALGEQFGDLTSCGFAKMFEGKPIIQIDIDPEAIGRNFPVAVGIVADARVGLEALCRSLVPGPRLTQPGPILARYAAPIPGLDEIVARVGQGPLHPRAVMQMLTHLIPQNAFVLADIGSAPMVWSTEVMRRRMPYRWVLPQKFGAMGSALAGVLGAAVATGDPVVLLVGDGGFFQTNGAELRSALFAGVGYTTIVLNDGGFGMVEEGFQLLPGAYPSAMYPSHCSAAASASAIYIEDERGITRVRAFDVRTAQQLVEAVPHAISSTIPTPTVIDVRIWPDPSDPAPMSIRAASFEG